MTGLSKNTQLAQTAMIKTIRGPTIWLGSGRYFDYLAPETTPLDIEDVAYGLAFACRFQGQARAKATGSRVFYSVAEHCVRMARVIPDPHKLAALMHELGEATCGDMAGPLKSICPEFKVVEKRCEAAALAHFGVVIPDADFLKVYDLRMLATEKRDLTGARDTWEWIRGYEPFDWTVEPWSPDEAASEFLKEYAWLTGCGRQVNFSEIAR